jgi:sulfatase modifying factor 1
LPPAGDADPDSPDIDASDGSTGLACPTGRGPAMVLVASDGGAHCIDSTEVTNADYDVFLAANDAGLDAGSLDAGPASACFSRASYARAAGDAGRPTEPANLVDWCDAYVYCVWAGKQLCSGQQWLADCTHAGTRPLPYGDAAVDGACNVAGVGREPVMSRPGCEGAYPGVFDLVGNVAEYVDDCDPTGACRINGGHWQDRADASCTTHDFVRRVGFTTETGMRCCAIPK